MQTLRMVLSWSSKLKLLGIPAALTVKVSGGDEPLKELRRPRPGRLSAGTPPPNYRSGVVFLVRMGGYLMLTGTPDPATDADAIQHNGLAPVTSLLQLPA